MTKSLLFSKHYWVDVSSNACGVVEQRCPCGEYRHKVTINSCVNGKKYKVLSDWINGFHPEFARLRREIERARKKP